MVKENKMITTLRFEKPVWKEVLKLAEQRVFGSEVDSGNAVVRRFVDDGLARLKKEKAK